MLHCDNTHTYFLDSVQIPGTTRLLSDHGISDFSRVNKRVLEKAQLFGDAVHMTTELYDKGTLCFDTLDKNLKPYLRGWIKFRKDFGFDPEHIEFMDFHPKYKYGFKLDRVGIINKGRHKGKRAIVEIKSCELRPAVGIQMASYQDGWNANNKKTKVTLRIAVQLIENDYRHEIYKNKLDFQVFLACLTIENWKKINEID